MFRNYLAAALRNLARNKLYSAISIFGLAIGICAALLIGVIIRNQLTYDHFIPGYERTYLYVGHTTLGGTEQYQPGAPLDFAALFKLEFPQVEAATRLWAENQLSLRRGRVELSETIYWADPNVFNVLPLHVVAGDLKTALARPDGIVLTRSTARKYFGRDDVIGQTIELITQPRSRHDKKLTTTIPGGPHPMTVTAVIEDLPGNATQLETGIFASSKASFSAYAALSDSATAPDSFAPRGLTYLRLVPNALVASIQDAMPAFLREHRSPLYADLTTQQHYSVELIRLDQVHLFPGLNPGIENFLGIGGLTGVMILFIACINFVNLSTARSTRRALEVGIRKVSGADRRALILQFLGEAMIYVAVATCVAIALAEVLLPYVSATLGSGATFAYWQDPLLGTALVLGVLILSILAGLYPAFVLSSFRPTNVLKGQVSTSQCSIVLRQVLVTAQFAILIALVVAATVVHRQHEYATTDALRVDTDQMLVIRYPLGGSGGPLTTCRDALITQLRALPGVRGAYCGSILSNFVALGEVKLKDDSIFGVNFINVEPGLLELYGLKPFAGRFFALHTPPVNQTILINEATARRLGYASPLTAVGQSVKLDPTTPPSEIIGVVPDFQFNTLEMADARRRGYDVPNQSPVDKPVEPAVYINEPCCAITLKLTGRDIPETLKAIDKTWTETGQQGPIDRIFVDEYIQNLYLTMLRQGQVFAVFSGVAVLLACLGLIGLAMSTAERRTKEIGIRKAMGAETSDILRLLTWEFAKPVLWANLIAWPIAYYAMNRWLNGFAYHIALSPWMFAAAGALALLVALATVSAQSFITARAKPVSALRYE